VLHVLHAVEVVVEADHVAPAVVDPLQLAAEVALGQRVRLDLQLGLGVAVQLDLVLAHEHDEVLGLEHLGRQNVARPPVRRDHDLALGLPAGRRR
jgi:hypothetical protein